jgi:hypothetical protein
LSVSCDATSSITTSGARTGAWPTRRRCRRRVPKHGVRRTSAGCFAATSSVD